MDPLVTVLTPAFNRVSYINDTVRSVQSQTYRNIEYLVIDDGSTDGTLEALDSYARKGILTLLTHEDRRNRGQAASLNLGLRQAAGEYIVILDSDDILHPEKISKQVAYLESHPDIGMVYGQAMAISSDGKELFPIPPNDHVEPGDPNRLLLDCYMALPGGAMVRKSVFDQAGFFEESFRASQDHDMVVRIAEVAPFVYLPGIVFYYRKHAESISQQGLERRWMVGFEILARAKKRFSYRSSTIRKRKALLHFRMGQVRWFQRRLLSALWHFSRAGLGDPKRSIAVILGFEKAR
ncbi:MULTISPECIES: glycosyltransferase [Marinobacter]|jgi:glycosyltransferase involved in cell wall biosynthesis|uniref:glycosyltransferase n=1 Tax=Marinobacter TaxID=2742 RepID=UPI00241E877D|nr:glycosyltransferase [Marinobacter nauticus]|tara:strand:+ start:2412 stop:3293 length:882 start_codon:yes stop_codon:yes gene_type:complete